MKNLSVIRSFAAVASLVAAFVFVGCSDDSSPIESDTTSVTQSSDDAEIVSSSSAKLEEPASSSSKKVRSSSSEEDEELSSSSKKEKKSSSSSVENEEDSSSSDADEPVVIVPVQQDVRIAASSLESRISGDDVRFKGRFSLDVTESVNNNVVFTGITFMVAKGSDVRSLVRTPVTVNVNSILFPTMNDIDLNSMSSAGISISLLDPGFNGECGIYSLIVTVTASNGVADFMRTEVIQFEREAAEYCSEGKSSSSVAQNTEIPMVSCQVELSTNMNSGLDLATCTAVPAAIAVTSADIFFSKAKLDGRSEVTAISHNGIKIGRINNGDFPPFSDDYEVDIWPEDINVDRNPACAYVSDFKFVEPDPGTTIFSMIENSYQIYVALAPGYSTETGAGFYAFAITDPSQGNNGDYTLTIKVYKVQ